MLMARLESSPEELAGLIIEADEQSLGQQAIKCLVKIMPTDEEVYNMFLVETLNTNLRYMIFLKV